MKEPIQLALIGDPVAHSLSPKIYTLFAQYAGVDCVYDAVRVCDGEAGLFVQQARTTLRGFNVTMPHKRAVIPFLHTLDDSVRTAGAVNTVVNDGGRLAGYNTDGAGFVLSLERLGVTPTRALVLGDGGAAQTVANTLASQGVAVTVAARRIEDRREQGGVSYVPWVGIRRRAATCDLLVNGTPLGMVRHDPFPTLSFVDVLPAHAFVYDLIYEPRDTALTQAAAARGLRATTGLPMLVGQAALAFFLFTGVMPDDETIEQVFRSLDAPV